jgi:hypothetical protein
MITAVLPATNHKPNWIELEIDGVHIGRIWAHAVEVKLENAVHQFMLTVSGQNDVIEAFLWADVIRQPKE